MPSFFTSVAVPALALAGGAFANPFKRGDDACLAAVTGKAALGDDNLRKDHCSSFIKTIVTPAAITVTTTITDAPSPTAWENYKRAVTYCPNEVPNYASACDEDAYKSACKVFGISSETTITIPATTTTETVYWGNGYDGSCTDGTATVTSTVTSADATITSTVTAADNTVTTTITNGGFGGHGTYTGGVNSTIVTSTVTKDGETHTFTYTSTYASDIVTVTSTATTTVTGTHTVSPTGAVASGVFPAGSGDKCISKEQADTLVLGFIDLLQYTSYPGNNATYTPAGRGYHQNVSDATLDVNFSDYSDSINWMAGFELGTVTFATKAAFDYGQGVAQPEVVAETLNTWYGCNTITWRWLLTPPTGAKVRGINQFIINPDSGKILTNYAEFDNAAWLSSYGLNCKLS